MSRKELAKLVEAWRKVLTPEWRVTLMDKSPEDGEADDFWAIARTADDYLAIRLHFTDDCLKRSPREIEITVVHELLHALTRPWRDQINRLSFELGDIRTSALRREREHEEEKLVDRLAYVLVAQTHRAEPVGVIEGGKAEW